MTATPTREEYTLDELQAIPVIKAHPLFEPDKIYVDNKKNRKLQEAIISLITDHLNQNRPTNLHIFVNSLQFIERVVRNCAKALKKQCPSHPGANAPVLNNLNCRAVWSDSNPITYFHIDKKYSPPKNNTASSETDQWLFNRSKTTDTAKKINFYTSCSFEGCDIFDPDGEIIIVSDGNSATTLTDIFTTFRQICGRIRNTRYGNVVRHYYSKSRYLQDRNFKEQQERIKTKGKYAPKLVAIYNKSFAFDESEEILALKYLVNLEPKYAQKSTDIALPDQPSSSPVAQDINIKRREKMNLPAKLPVDKVGFDHNLVTLDLLNSELTLDTYLDEEKLKAQQEEANFLLDKEPEDFYLPSDKLALPANKHIVKLERVVQELYELNLENSTKIPSSCSPSSQRRLELLNNYHPFSDDGNITLGECFTLIGDEWMMSRAKRPGDICRKLDDLSDRPHRQTILEKLKENKIEEGNCYSNKVLKELFTQIYHELKIKKTPLAIDINLYFEAVKKRTGWKLSRQKEMSESANPNPRIIPFETIETVLETETISHYREVKI